MRNFHKLASGLNVAPLVAKLYRHPELWDRDRTRTDFEGSPHAQASDILLRFGKPTLNDTGPFENRPSMAILGAKDLVLGVMQLVGGFELGRVIVSRLGPGLTIAPHADEGLYSERVIRHQVMLECLPGNVFRCGGEEMCPTGGDLFWFNNKLEHEVINNSVADRLALIIDVRME